MESALEKILALFVAVVALHAAAAGDTYPARPVKIILPSPAGSGPDAETRKFAAELSVQLGQPVVVENRPGGGGFIAMEAVAKARPDGYTLGAGQIGNLGANPKLFDGSAPFDADRDIAAVSLLGMHRWMLVVNAAVPAHSLAEFIALAKAKPGDMTVAATGIGSMQQVSGAWFEMLTGARLTIVPYGATFWQSDLLAGNVKATFYPPISLVPHIHAGRLRALAISGSDRCRLLPDVPTFAEAGLPRFTDTYAWFGLVAPAGIPAPIMEKISAATIRAAHSVSFRGYMESLCGTAVGSTVHEFAAFLADERAKWKRVVTEAGIKLE